MGSPNASLQFQTEVLCGSSVVSRWLQMITHWCPVFLACWL
uniref:Uncharacterized protein n=1 Tax=Anguilla anguilla TaxID=7936 RepID=A0A0E9VEN7_ANGAN